VDFECGSSLETSVCCHAHTTASMFEVTNGNSVDLPTTHINNTNLTSLFGDMSIQVYYIYRASVQLYQYDVLYQYDIHKLLL